MKLNDEVNHLNGNNFLYACEWIDSHVSDACRTSLGFIMVHRGCRTSPEMRELNVLKNNI